MDRRTFLKSILAATGMGAALAAGLPLHLAIEKLNEHIAAEHPAEPPATTTELGALLMAVYLPEIREQLEAESSLLRALADWPRRLRVERQRKWERNLLRNPGDAAAEQARREDRRAAQKKKS